MTLTANGITEDEYEGIVPAYEYATDVTTTSGEDAPYLGGTTSEGGFEPEQRLSGFAIRNAAAHWQKMIWCMPLTSQTSSTSLIVIAMFVRHPPAGGIGGHSTTSPV